MKSTIGYLLLALSCLAWLLVFLVPFVELSGTQQAATVTGLIIVGEGAFYVSVLFLGKPFFARLKAWFGWKSEQLPDEEKGIRIQHSELVKPVVEPESDGELSKR